MSTYCVSDIHGEYGMFRKLLEVIRFKAEDTLYILGDMVDRGPDPIKTVFAVKDTPNMIPILGNHELMAVFSLQTLGREITEQSIDEMTDDVYVRVVSWINDGGSSTLRGYLNLNPEKQDEFCAFLTGLPPYREVQAGSRKFLLVHAGLSNFSAGRDLSDYKAEELVWKRQAYDKTYFSDTIIVSGHTPTQLIHENRRPGYIFRSHNNIAIDCGACFGGRLAALCLETMEEFYVEAQEQ